MNIAHTTARDAGEPALHSLPLLQTALQASESRLSSGVGDLPRSKVPSILGSSQDGEEMAEQTMDDDLDGEEWMPSEEQEELLKRLQRRVARRMSERPRLVRDVGPLLGEITERTVETVRECETVKQYWCRMVGDGDLYLHEGLSAIEHRLQGELETGTWKWSTWETEVEELERRTRMLQKRHEVELSVLSRGDQVKVDGERKRRALMFAVRMRGASRQRERRRQESAEKREEELRRRLEMIEEERERERREATERHHQRAVAGLEAIQEARKARAEKFREGERRQRVVLRGVPLHVRVQREFSRAEDLLYRGRGPPLEELEALREMRRGRGGREKLEQLLDRSHHQARTQAHIQKRLDRTNAAHHSLDLDQSQEYLPTHFARLPRVKYAK